ncbi:MAG: DUF4340 domain-containing protein [Lachnospiraceae bacterium]|nr:DUF4340 domain-containing protein [Lachnospiraceae bacterium]
MKKKKKSIGLLIGIAALAVLAGAYFAVGQIDWEKEETTERQIFYSVDPGQVQSVQLVSSTHNYTLELTEDAWICPERPEETVNQAEAEVLLGTIVEIAAERVLGDAPESLGSYGLEEPQMQIIVTLEDGSQTEISIGNTAQDGNDYAIQSRDQVLCTIDTGIYDAFYIPVENLLEAEAEAEETTGETPEDTENTEETEESE